MARSKLKSALDQYRGRNIRLEKQRKKEKEARKRKEQRQAANQDGGNEGAQVEEQKKQEEEGEEVAVKANGQTKNKAQAKTNGAAKDAEAVGEPDWETDDSEEELDSEEERTKANLAKLEDSDSEGSSEDDADDDGEEQEGAAEEEEEDIPLSDIESLASADKEDVVPHQRLTINNTTALTAALNRISLPYSKLAFSEHQSITSDEPTEIADVDDDLNRELAFYKQSLAAVKDARAKLKQEGVPFSRPADYFAEMVKSDEHMGKIKQKLIDDAAAKKAAAEARRQRDLKKFGKQVQVAKLQERAKEKRETLEKINILKRKRQGADPTNATEDDDLFDVELDNAAKSDRRRDSSGKQPNFKRQKKDAKYGFGGKKRHAKSNDAFSTSDTRGPKRVKTKAKAQRPGKSRRAKKV
ncbi:Ebp2-domain-containing protein [Westerdykella ornata]|uniref:Ebp2-domain-containing protein n=1 Tax=Westerdykella ornata TaxID=318751 RepID=A0A6A6JY10_WESOR|nr:Ebp2-domain-containing protein [Westerdykella ornata]KAF2281094.1 Ebp2-domain-containing protein [Westerdykella ornata]